MLKQRLLAALVLVPIVLLAVFKLPPLGFRLFVGLFVAMAFWEWSAFVTSELRQRQLFRWFIRGIDGLCGFYQYCMA